MALVAAAVPYDLAPMGVSIVGAATLLASAVVARGLLREIGASRNVRLAGTILVLAAYPTVFWTLRGMEVGALALLLMAAVRLALVDRGRQQQVGRLLLLSTTAGAALLIRNDAVLVFLPIFGYIVLKQQRARPPLLALLPLIACAAGQVAFRYAYYGDLEPNTYVLKMTGVALGTRLAAGLVTVADTLPVAGPAIVVLAVAASVARTSPRVRELSRLALATLLVQWVYVVWIGGDAWLINYSNRFIATVLPLLLVAAVAGAPACFELLRQSRAAAAWFVAVTILVLFCLGVRHPHAFLFGPQWLLLAGWVVAIGAGILAQAPAARPVLHARHLTTAAVLALFLASSAHGWVAWTVDGAPKSADDIAFARLGLMLRDRLPPDAVIAAGWVGAPAYYSRLTAVDLLGKTDPHVARAPARGVFRPGHNKMDLAYSVGQLRPDVVVFDDAAIASYGYHRLSNGLWLRPGAPAAYARDLGASWCTAPSDSVYCPQIEDTDR
jgi:hypothetical protein